MKGNREIPATPAARRSARGCQPRRATEIAITVGVDGRIYCHDLPPGLLPVLMELCPGDAALRARQALLRRQEPPHD